ncbi:MAG: 50S ribosomal protein L10 [Deltaproteobacteria bacterium]|nr:50S ribosomal protein L10 [Deltaproteobacteria bacterium]MBZ0219650.1 50S ribosomal protein L10 [Deltaproteobacteria bacterium]
MDRTEKTRIIEEVQESFRKANATFIAEYQGIKALEMNEFRKALRDASMEFRVVRNTLARRAVQGTQIESMAADLKGPTAIAFSFKDAAAAAKALVEFTKTQPKLKLKTGTLGARVLSIADIKGLSELPSREVLLGKMLGSMKSPVTGMAVVLSAVPKKLLYALNAVKEKKAEAGAA